MRYISVALLLLSVSFSSNSLIIGSSDVDSISFDLPTGWTASNESALFDGVTKRFGASRFIGFRNNGSDLTLSNPFQIDVDFNSLFDISSFAFYNDWGHHLHQQVASITIDFLDSAAQTIFSNFRSDVQLNSFSLVNVFSTTNAIKDVAGISVKISGIQRTNFEIREFVLEASRSQLAGQNQVNAPVFGLGLAAMLMLGVFMNRNRKV